jgi:hypothetical protein
VGEFAANLEAELDHLTRTTSFAEGFKFLGAIFLGDSVFLPFDRPKHEWTSPKLPPPLDLLTYLEMRNLE